MTPYIGRKIKIYDSAGKKLVGFIKEAGSGETYDSELLSNTSLESNLDNWNIGPGNTADIDSRWTIWKLWANYR